MPCSIRRSRRFPVHCAVLYHAEPFLKQPLVYHSGDGSVCGTAVFFDVGQG